MIRLVKRILERQAVFNLKLKLLSFNAQKRYFDKITYWATTSSAKMNVLRSLLKEDGGELAVLESQSNSVKDYCRLAIRKKGDDTRDFVPNHYQARFN